jgi:hypothetical protein
LFEVGQRHGPEDQVSILLDNHGIWDDPPPKALDQVEIQPECRFELHGDSVPAGVFSPGNGPIKD